MFAFIGAIIQTTVPDFRRGGGGGGGGLGGGGGGEGGGTWGAPVT